MIIESIGTSVGNGFYTEVHSRFNDVVNFTQKDGLVISLVSPRIGGSPFNIVISGVDLSKVKEIEVKENMLIVNRSFEIVSGFRKDFSTPAYSAVKIQRLIDNLAGSAAKHQGKKSLWFLIDPDLDSEFTSTIERAFVMRSKTAYKTLLEGNFVNAVRALKGMGFGLTPSGDDFNSGLLTGLCLLEKVRKIEYAALKFAIFETAKGENAISNTSLFISNRGMCSEKSLKLLNALSEGKDMDAAFTEYFSVGASSGSDFLAGLYLSLKQNYDS